MQCINEPWSIADDEKVPLRTSEALWKGWVCQNELLVTDNAKFLTFHSDCSSVSCVKSILIFTLEKTRDQEKRGGLTQICAA